MSELSNDFLPLMTAYSLTLRPTGPDSPEVARFREKHASTPGFLEYADALDRVNRALGIRKPPLRGTVTFAPHGPAAEPGEWEVVT